MGVPAIVTAGDRRAAKAVYGESKVYLQVEGVPLVARVVQVLQHVPEVTEVWVIGSTERLESVLGAAGVQASLTKPLRIIEQRRNLCLCIFLDLDYARYRRNSLPKSSFDFE